MSRLHPLERPFRRHMGTFQRNLGPALEGEPEPLQRCYGATRRLRELAPLLAAEIGSAVVGETRVRLRRVGRALGPVREIDVALGLVGEWVADDRARQDAVEGLRQHLLDAGAVARERMTGQVESAQAATLARRMQAIGSALSASTTGIWSRTLSLRMTRRAQHLREVVEAAGALYLPDRVQAVARRLHQPAAAGGASLRGGTRHGHPTLEPARRCRLPCHAAQDEAGRPADSAPRLEAPHGVQLILETTAALTSHI